MCGIIGYLGTDKCRNILLDGLKQLQNRGYDSAGICLLRDNSYNLVKYASNDESNAIVKLNESEKLKNSNFGIGHTRWATHGKKNNINSHPHLSHDNKIAVVHNGIIENFKEIKNRLIKEGIVFKSQTDTETIPNLLAFNYKNSKNFTECIKKTLTQLEGTWGLAIMNLDEPNKMYCVRHGSPLLISCNEDFALVASELSGFNNMVSNYFILNNNDICEIELRNGKINYQTNIQYELKEASKFNYALTPEPFPHWTIKEIYEQYESSLRTISFGGRIFDNTEVKLGGLNDQKKRLKEIDNVIFLGCGTSYFAGLFGMSYFKYLCNFNVLQIFDGAEFTIEDIPLIGNTLLIFLSQSGETKDLHRCVELGRNNNLFMLGVTNVVDSMIAREVHCGTYLNSGREVGVASTKCFTSQVIALNLIALWFSKIHNTGENKRIKVLKDLRNLPQDIKKCVKYCDEIIKKEKITEIFHKNNSMFVLGKGQCEATAKEGSLKIKEISYYHAEGYSGSSLKHGPFALLEKDFPVILIAPNDKHYSKMKSVYQEIKSREASILLITDNKSCKIDNYSKTIVIPSNDTFSSLLSIIPLQLLAYHLSIERGINPDFPKNLAKSVVVD